MLRDLLFRKQELKRRTNSEGLSGIPQLTQSRFLPPGTKCHPFLTPSAQTYQRVQVDVGPLNLLGLPVVLHHGPAQNVQVLLRLGGTNTCTALLHHKREQHTRRLRAYLGVDPDGTDGRDLIVIPWDKHKVHDHKCLDPAPHPQECWYLCCCRPSTGSALCRSCAGPRRT